MPANIFKLEGLIADNQKKFLEMKNSEGWSNILYMAATFEPDGKIPLVFKKNKFSRISFKDTEIKRVRFLHCEFTECIFIGAILDNCEFINCKFISTNTNKIKIRNSFLDPISFSKNFDLISDTNIAINLYHALYKNSQEEHQSKFAVESLYNMRDAEFKHLDSQRKRDLIPCRTYLRQKFVGAISKFISGYGLRSRRIIRFAAILIVLFTSMNYIFREYIFNEKLEGLLDAFYFTIITITTLGYGDIVPTTTLGKLLVVMQAISGFSVLSLLLTSVANKVFQGR